MKADKINVDDLNGITDNEMKVITLTLQEHDLIKFSALCEEKLKSIHNEVLIHFSVHNIAIPSPQGIVLMFVANILYWANKIEHEAWLEELKRKNLLIKV
jgi:hypothetical protein